MTRHVILQSMSMSTMTTSSMSDTSMQVLSVVLNMGKSLVGRCINVFEWFSMLVQKGWRFADKQDATVLPNFTAVFWILRLFLAANVAAIM